MPLIQPEEAEWVAHNPEMACKVSCARCARVSYLTHDGRRDIEADLTLYERLVSGGHMSPLEHVATPNCTYQLLPTEVVGRGKMGWEGEWEGNLYGWGQLRKFVPNEHDFSLVEKED